VHLMLYKRERMFENSWQTSMSPQDQGSYVTSIEHWICLQADEWMTSHVRKSVTSARDLWLLYSVTIHNLISPWQLYRLQVMRVYKETYQLHSSLDVLPIDKEERRPRDENQSDWAKTSATHVDSGLSRNSAATRT
jgi:hypothetical protein